MDGFRELLQLGGGTLDQPKRRGSDDIDEVLRGPKGQNIRNFFEAIRWAEGGEPDIIVGGRERFDIKGDHPNKVGLVTPAGPSTAAGNYQITGTNWYGTKNRKGLKARIGAKDFGPENQLRGALRLFADRDNGAGLTALLNDDYETALKIAGKDWASLPGSSLYGKKRSRDEFFKRLKGYNQNVNPKQPGGEFEQLLNAGADNPEPEDEFQALLRYGQEESDQKTPQVPNQNMAPTQTSVPTKDGQVTESDPLDDNTVRQPLKFAKTVVYPNDESRFTESDEARRNRFSGITDTSVPGARPQSKREYVIDEVSGEIADKLSNPKIGLKIDREDVALVLKRYGFRGDDPNAVEKGYVFKIDENDPQDRDFINSIYQAHDLKEAVALDLISNGAPISGTLYETLYQKYGITPEYIKEKSSGTDEYFKQAVAQGDANRQLFDNFVQEETKKLQPGQSPEIAVNNAMAQTGWLEKEKLQAANEKSQRDFDHLVEETSGSLFDSARFFNEYVKKPLAYGVNTASNYPVFENIPKWSKEQSLEIAKEIVAKYGTVENYYRRQEELRQKYERGSGNAMAGPFEFVKRFGIGALKIAPQLGKAMSFLSTPAVLIYGTNKLQSYISGSPVLQSEDNPFYKISDRAEKFLDELKNSDFDDVESISLVADTLGQLTTQIVAGTLTGGATVPTLLGATAGASQMLDDAVQKKATPLNVIAAGTVGALAAAPEGLILGKWFSKLGGAEKTHFLDSLFGSLLKRYGIEFGEKEAVEMTKATMRSMLSTAGKNILAGSVFEGTQEVTENHINDLAAYILYDQTPERWKKATTLTKEDAQSFVGGVIGGAFGGSFETAVEVLNSTQRQKLYEDLPSLMAENKFYEKYYLELKDALEKEAKTAEDRATYAAAIERDAELRQAPIDNELLKTLGYRPQDIERLSADDITVIQDNNLARETFRELKRKQVEALTGGALKPIGPEKSEIEAQTFEPSISTKITGPKKPPTPPPTTPPAAPSAPAAPAKPKTETVAPVAPITPIDEDTPVQSAKANFETDLGNGFGLKTKQFETGSKFTINKGENKSEAISSWGKNNPAAVHAADDFDTFRQMLGHLNQNEEKNVILSDAIPQKFIDRAVDEGLLKVSKTKVKGTDRYAASLATGAKFDNAETRYTLPQTKERQYGTSYRLPADTPKSQLPKGKTIVVLPSGEYRVYDKAGSTKPTNALPPKSQEKTTKAEKAKEEPKPVISDYVSESDAHAELQKKMGFEHAGTHGHDAIDRKVDSWTKEKDGVTTTKFTVSRMGKTVAAAGIRTDAEAILKNFDFTDESKNTLAGITSPLDIRQVSVGRGGKGEVELSAGSQKYSLAFKSTSLTGVKGAKEAVKKTPKKEKAPPTAKAKDVPPLEPVSKPTSKKAKGLEVGATVSIKGPAYRGKTYVIESVHGKGRDAKYRVTHNGQKVPKTFTAENFKPEESPVQESRISQTKKSIVGVLGAEELAKANQPVVKQNLAIARKMLADGINDYAIFRATGWQLTKDGHWKYDLPNYGKFDYEKLRTLPLDKKVKLSEIFQSASLFEAYPALKNYSVMFDSRLTVNFFFKRGRKGSSGYFQPDSKLIGLNPGYQRSGIRGSVWRALGDLENTLIHEIQHAIQGIEGFPSGNLEFFTVEDGWQKGDYFTNAGEIEARNAARRELMRIFPEFYKEPSKVNLPITETEDSKKTWWLARETGPEIDSAEARHGFKKSVVDIRNLPVPEAPTFAEKFQNRIKQRDKSLEDLRRIGEEILAEMQAAPEEWVHKPTSLSIEPFLRMPDGERYDPNNIDHLTAPIAVVQAYELTKKPDLLKKSLEDEAELIFQKRLEDFQGLLDYLLNIGEYTSSEAALVAAAASMWSVKYIDGEVRLENIGNNRHNISVVDSTMAPAIVEQLRKGLSLKEAFKKGALIGIKLSQKKNANSGKNGWQRYEKSDQMSDAAKLNQGCAGTNWCTFTEGKTTAKSHLSGGDFYVFYKDGRPEVAIRTVNNDVAEIRGNTPNQAVPEEYTPVLEKFFKENRKITGGDILDNYKKRMETLKEVIQEKELTEKALDFAVKEGYFFWNTFTGEFSRDSRAFTASRQMRINLSPEIKKRLNKLFSGITATDLYERGYLFYGAHDADVVAKYADKITFVVDTVSLKRNRQSTDPLEIKLPAVKTLKSLHIESGIRGLTLNLPNLKTLESALIRPKYFKLISPKISRIDHLTAPMGVVSALPLNLKMSTFEVINVHSDEDIKTFEKFIKGRSLDSLSFNQGVYGEYVPKPITWEIPDDLNLTVDHLRTGVSIKNNGGLKITTSLSGGSTGTIWDNVTTDLEYVSAPGGIINLSKLTTIRDNAHVDSNGVLNFPNAEKIKRIRNYRGSVDAPKAWVEIAAFSQRLSNSHATTIVRGANLVDGHSYTTVSRQSATAFGTDKRGLFFGDARDVNITGEANIILKTATSLNSVTVENGTVLTANKVVDINSIDFKGKESEINVPNVERISNVRVKTSARGSTLDISNEVAQKLRKPTRDNLDIPKYRPLNPKLLKSVSDIRKLHPAYSPTFADKFQTLIKAKDRTIGDMMRLGREILSDMLDNPEKWIKAPTGLTLESLLTLPGGERYDPENPDHLDAPDNIIKLYEIAQNNPKELSQALFDEQLAIFEQRINDFRQLVTYLDSNHVLYPPSIGALIAAAAAKWSIKYDQETDTIKLSEIGNNRHNVSVIGPVMAPALMEALNKGLPLKEAFREGAKVAMKRAMMQNKRKGFTGWEVFKKSDRIEDAIELSDAAAGTEWCTFTGGSSTARTQLRLGDFHIYYKDGRPEVAVRFVDKRVEETRGNTPAQALTEEQADVLAKYFHENASEWEGAEDILRDSEMRKAIKSIIKNDAILPEHFNFISGIVLFVNDKISYSQDRLRRPLSVVGYRGNRQFPPSIMAKLQKVFDKYTTLVDFLKIGFVPAGVYARGHGKLVASFAPIITHIGDTSGSKESRVVLLADSKENIVFPKVTSIGVLTFSRLGFNFEFPNATQIKGLFNQVTPLTERKNWVKLPKITEIDEIYGDLKTEFLIPNLKSIGKVTINQNGMATSSYEIVAAKRTDPMDLVNSGIQIKHLSIELSRLQEEFVIPKTANILKLKIGPGTSVRNLAENGPKIIALDWGAAYTDVASKVIDTLIVDSENTVELRSTEHIGSIEYNLYGNTNLVNDDERFIVRIIAPNVKSIDTATLNGARLHTPDAVINTLVVNNIAEIKSNITAAEAKSVAVYTPSGDWIYNELDIRKMDALKIGYGAAASTTASHISVVSLRNKTRFKAPNLTSVDKITFGNMGRYELPLLESGEYEFVPTDDGIPDSIQRTIFDPTPPIMELSKENSKILKNIIGKVGVTQKSTIRELSDQLNSLDAAKEDIAKGVNPLQVWRETGWIYDSVAKEFKQHISTKDAYFTTRGLQEVISKEDSIAFNNSQLNYTDTPEGKKEFEKVKKAYEEWKKNPNDPKTTREKNRTRVEFDDNSKLYYKKVHGLPLDEILDFPELFQAYPEMRGIRVKFYNRLYGRKAYYSGASPITMTMSDGSIRTANYPGVIALSRHRDQQEMFSSLLHEVQHAIQHRERFPTGTSTEVIEGDYVTLETRFNQRNQFHLLTKGHINKLLTIPIKEFQNKSSYAISKMVDMYGYPQLTYMIEHVQDALKRFPRKDPVQLSRLILKEFDRQNEEAIKLLESEFEKGLKQVNDAYGIATPAKPLRTFNAEQLATQAYFASHGEIEARLVQQLDRLEEHTDISEKTIAEKIINDLNRPDSWTQIDRGMFGYHNLQQVYHSKQIEISSHPHGQGTPVTKPILFNKALDHRMLHLANQDGITEDHIKGLNSKIIEGNIYVSPEMMDITRRIAGSFDPTMQTVITGFSAESEDIGKLIAAFKDIKKQMREAGYEPIQLKAIDKIIKQLNDLGTDKPIVIYTDGDILPHEMTHKLRSIHAELGPLASYYSNFDEVYKKTEPLAKKAYSAFYRENYFEGKAYSKLTTADKLLLQEEMIATIVNGNYEDLGLTDREAAEFLFNDLSNYVQTHGTDIVDSLERWINEKLRLSGVLSAVKNNYGSLPEESESGERATSAGEPEKQKTESKHEPKSKTAQRQTPETIAKHTNLQFEDLGTHADEYIVKNRIAQSNEAEKWLNEVGIGVAYEEALGLTEASALNTAKRMAVIEYIDDKVDFFTENNNIARAKAWYDLLVRFTNAISPQFTEYGQAISQLAKWNNYDPERIITTLQKGLRNSKTPRDLTFDEQNAIRQWSEDIAQLHFEEKQLVRARDEFDNETVRRMIIAARRMATGAVAHLKGIFPSAAEEADIILNPDENIKKSVVGNPIEEKPLTELDAVTQKALTDLGLLVHLQGEFPYKYQDWQSAFANELSNLGIANFPVEVYQRAIYRNVLAQEISLKHMIRLEQIMDKFGFTEVGQAYEKLAEMKAKRIANRIILSDNKKYANENPDKRTVMEIAIDNELTSSGSLISREDVLLAFDRNKFFGEMAKKGLSFTATMNQYLDALDIIHKAQIELKKERRLIRAQKQLANKGVIGGFTEAEIDENDAKLNEIRVTKARKTRELNRFIAEIKKQPASRSQRAADWYKRINRSGEALLTATLKTAAHNVIAQRTTKAFYAIEMALSVLFQKTPLLNQIFEEDPMMYDQDVKFWQPLIEDLSGSFSFSNARAAIDEMRNGDANLVEALKLLMLHKERVAQGFLAHNPDLYDKMIGQFTYGDVKEHVHPISKDWNRATRGMEKFVRGMEHYVNWATVLNRIQEKHFRFSTFIANVNLQLKAKGIDPFTVNAEDIPRHMLEIAVKRALEDTFGEDFNLDSVVGQAVDRTSEAMSWIPFPINPLLFRRFFFNSLKFVYDHSAMMPVKLVTTGKISARDMAKFSTGLLMFLVSLQMLRQFGADDDDPTLLKFFGRHYRMSAYNPLANFLVLANVVNRSLKGKSPLKDSANLLDLIGIDSRYPNQGLTFLKDFFNAFGTSPTKLEAFSKTAKITGGKALAAFARPLATLRDLATLFDGDQAVLRDYHEAPFSGELMKITPWGDNLGEEFFGLNIPKRRDEVKDDYIRKDAPILDQLGITYVSDSLVGPKMTPAEEYLDTETANNRFVIKYRTVEEKRTAAIMSQFYQAIDKGVDIRPRLKAMQTERKLDQEHVKKLMDSFRIKNTLIRKSKGASILQLITAMDYGDEQEKGVLKKVIKRKILAARSPFDEFEKARIRQVFPNFR